MRKRAKEGSSSLDKPLPVTSLTKLSSGLIVKGSWRLQADLFLGLGALNFAVWDKNHLPTAAKRILSIHSTEQQNKLDFLTATKREIARERERERAV